MNTKQWAFFLFLLIALPFGGAVMDPTLDVSTLFSPYAINIRSENVLPLQPSSAKLSIALALFGMILVSTFLVKLGLNFFLLGHSSGRRFSTLPKWGWAALVVLLIFWYIAWAQPIDLLIVKQLTFTFLWISYIVLVNAWSYSRIGTCLLIDQRSYLLKLYLFSIPFWWYFEYLNRYVLNWYYLVPDNFQPVQYLFFGSLAFGTVLPAVLSTRDLLLSFPAINPGFDRLPRLVIPKQKIAALVGCVIALFSLAFLGIYPLQLYPVLWMGPLLLLVSLQSLWGIKTIFHPATRGCYSVLVASSLSALICGFIWETWNFYSLPKWVYWVPWVGDIKIFEMPILGFLGYLPFGLECLAIGEMLEKS